METDEQAVPAEMRPAMQAASRAKQRLVEAAAMARPDRRPKAEMAEVAVPLTSALNYAVDALIDLQGQIVGLERLVHANADAAIATAAALDPDAGRLKS